MAEAHMGAPDDLVFCGPVRRMGLHNIVLKQDVQPAWILYRDLAATAIDVMVKEGRIPEIPE
jgi:hypothetical protein